MPLAFYYGILHQPDAGIGAHDGLEDSTVCKVIGYGKLGIVPQLIDFLGSAGGNNRAIHLEVTQLFQVAAELGSFAEFPVFTPAGLTYDDDQLIAFKGLLGKICFLYPSVAAYE